MEKQNFDNFRANLRLLRAEKLISANELSKQLGLKAAKRINDLEEGRILKPSLEELIVIADYFNVTIDNILNKKAIITFK